MKYEISPATDESKYLNIRFTLENCPAGQTTVHLPAWRPGRYELQNFAQFIRKVKAFDSADKPLAIRKTSRDSWQIFMETPGDLTISYQFYADSPNAGGSSWQSDFLYVNPVNCCLYHKDRLEKPCEMWVKFPANQSVACGLPTEKRDDLVIFSAATYHDLADSPFFIASKLQHIQYESHGTLFHLWVKGPSELPTEKVSHDFKRFTDAQIEIFGEFPEDSFHFMLWLSREASYHGVEHSRSTMMTLGPDTENFDHWYLDLLGLASHELFHAWNIKKIRPAELLPYDYSRENYFETCFVAEGLTTFYGDWILYRSGVFDRETWLKELETTLRRHFETADEADLSLLESSYDLWVDGYKKGVPHRKVSVYHKGAIAALILNDLITKATDNSRNLDYVMQLLWEKFGKPFKGYTYQDFQTLAAQACGKDLSSYFQEVIEGNTSILEVCNRALESACLKLQKNESGFFQLITLDR